MKRYLTIVVWTIVVCILLIAPQAWVGWRSTAGGTWIASGEKLRYTYLDHSNRDALIGAVFWPSDADPNLVSIWSGNREILVNGKPMRFPADKPFAILGHDGALEFLSIPAKYFVPNRHSRFGHPNISLMKSSGFWPTVRSRLSLPPK